MSFFVYSHMLSRYIDPVDDSEHEDQRLHDVGVSQDSHNVLDMYRKKNKSIKPPVPDTRQRPGKRMPS